VLQASNVINSALAKVKKLKLVLEAQRLFRTDTDSDQDVKRIDTFIAILREHTQP